MGEQMSKIKMRQNLGEAWANDYLNEKDLDESYSLGVIDNEEHKMFKIAMQKRKEERK